MSSSSSSSSSAVGQTISSSSGSGAPMNTTAVQVRLRIDGQCLFKDPTSARGRYLPGVDSRTHFQHLAKHLECFIYYLENALLPRLRAGKHICLVAYDERKVAIVSLLFILVLVRDIHGAEIDDPETVSRVVEYIKARFSDKWDDPSVRLEDIYGIVLFSKGAQGMRDVSTGMKASRLLPFIYNFQQHNTTHRQDQHTLLALREAAGLKNTIHRHDKLTPQQRFVRMDRRLGGRGVGEITLFDGTTFPRSTPSGPAFCGTTPTFHMGSLTVATTASFAGAAAGENRHVVTLDGMLSGIFTTHQRTLSIPCHASPVDLSQHVSRSSMSAAAADTAAQSGMSAVRAAFDALKNTLMQTLSGAALDVALRENEDKRRQALHAIQTTMQRQVRRPRMKKGSLRLEETLGLDSGTMVMHRHLTHERPGPSVPVVHHRRGSQVVYYHYWHGRFVKPSDGGRAYIERVAYSAAKRCPKRHPIPDPRAAVYPSHPKYYTLSQFGDAHSHQAPGRNYQSIVSEYAKKKTHIETQFSSGSDERKQALCAWARERATALSRKGKKRGNSGWRCVYIWNGTKWNPAQTFRVGHDGPEQYGSSKRPNSHTFKRPKKKRRKSGASSVNRASV